MRAGISLTVDGFHLYVGLLQVLLLFPMRNFARDAVRRLWQLAQKENRADSIQNKARSKLLPEL